MTAADVLRRRPMAAIKNHTIATGAMIVRESRISVRIFRRGATGAPAAVGKTV